MNDVTSKYRFPDDVAAPLQQLMASHRFASEDDVLRIALERLAREEADSEDDWPAIQAALDQLELGVECKPIETLIAEFEQRRTRQ